MNRQEGETLESATRAGRACRSLLMGWTDTTSGERLIVEVSGPATFLSDLNEHGFEVLTDASPGTPDRWGRRAAAVAVERVAEHSAQGGDPVPSHRGARVIGRHGDA